MYYRKCAVSNTLLLNKKGYLKPDEEDAWKEIRTGKKAREVRRVVEQLANRGVGERGRKTSSLCIFGDNRRDIASQLISVKGWNRERQRNGAPHRRNWWETVVPRGSESPIYSGEHTGCPGSNLDLEKNPFYAEI